MGEIGEVISDVKDALSDAEAEDFNVTDKEGTANHNGISKVEEIDLDIVEAATEVQLVSFFF